MVPCGRKTICRAQEATWPPILPEGNHKQGLMGSSCWRLRWSTIRSPRDATSHDPVLDRPPRRRHKKACDTVSADPPATSESCVGAVPSPECSSSMEFRRRRNAGEGGGGQGLENRVATRPGKQGPNERDNRTWPLRVQMFRRFGHGAGNGAFRPAQGIDLRAGNACRRKESLFGVEKTIANRGQFLTGKNQSGIGDTSSEKGLNVFVTTRTKERVGM